MIDSTLTDKKNKYSTPIGLLIVAIWGCIVVGMMLNKIKEFTNQYTDDNEYNKTAYDCITNMDDMCIVE